QMVTEEEKRKVRARAEERAEERLLDALVPASGSAAPPGGSLSETRETLRRMLRQGLLDDREVEVELAEAPATPSLSIFTPQGVEELGLQFKDLLGNLFPNRTRRRKLRVPAAREAFVAEEAARLVDPDKVREAAIQRVEQTGIVFLDEIDKIAASGGGKHGP